MKVSIVIPCLDAGAYLGPAIRSALNQTLPPHEIIVVDNGSTDRSAAIAEGFGAAVRLMHEPRKGAAAARAAGAAAARGDALMFLDADDLLGPEVLAVLAGVLAGHPDAVAICPWMRYREDDGAWLAEPPSCAPRRPGQDDLSAWLTGWYHPPCAVLWSRPTFDRSGGWDAAGGVNDDGDVMMRGLVRGNRLVLGEGATSYYRRLPGGQVSLSGTRETRAGTEARIAVLDRIATMLAERESLSRYAAPLAEAYGSIAAGCRGQPDLAAECRDRIGRLPPARRMRRRGLQRAAHAARALPAAALAAQGAWRDGWTGDPGPEVSVIVPSYNRAHLLARTLGTVFEQTFSDFELIVVDDGSTDDTAAVVTRMSDPRLRYLRQDPNQGVAAARNRGMAEAKGRFIAFLDSDDEWLPGKLERQVALLRSAPDRVGLVYTGVENVLPDRREIVRPTARGPIFEDMLLTNLLHGGGSNVMIRRSAVETVGGFDQTLPAIEDYDFWTRICRFHEVDFVDEPLVRYNDQRGKDDDRDALRRSRDLAANAHARAAFHARYRWDMRRAGVEHLFLLESARRMLDLPAQQRMAARVVLKAMRARPGDIRAYAWLPLIFLPQRGRELTRLFLRSVRDRLRFRPG